MNKKLTILSILLVIVVIFFGYSIFKNDKPIESNPSGQDVASTTDSTASTTSSNPETPSVNTEESSIIFFYGDGCPHCALVEKFFKDNNIESKVSFTQKEVYKNRDNANDLVTKAKSCGIDTNSIGVPFLWDGSKCLIGDQPIIDFFKQKVGIN